MQILRAKKGAGKPSDVAQALFAAIYPLAASVYSAHAEKAREAFVQRFKQVRYFGSKPAPDFMHTSCSSSLCICASWCHLLPASLDSSVGPVVQMFLRGQRAHSWKQLLFDKSAPSNWSAFVDPTHLSITSLLLTSTLITSCAADRHIPPAHWVAPKTYEQTVTAEAVPPDQPVSGIPALVPAPLPSTSVSDNPSSTTPSITPTNTSQRTVTPPAVPLRFQSAQASSPSQSSSSAPPSEEHDTPTSKKDKGKGKEQALPDVGNIGDKLLCNLLQSAGFEEAPRNEMQEHKLDVDPKLRAVFSKSVRIQQDAF